MRAAGGKILLVEDNPGDARLIRVMLAETGGARWELQHVENLAGALAQLPATAFDAALLDLSLPDSQGLDTLHRLHAAAPGLPIVVLTGLADEALGDRAVKEGAQEYLVKGQLDPTLLVRTLRHAVERQRLLDELQEEARALQAGEARLRTLIDRNADGIIVMDRTGTVRYANPAVETLLGQRAEGLIGQPAGTLAHAQDGNELELMDGRGEPRSVEIRSVDTEWEGDPRARLLFLHDVTERKQAQAALQRANERLEQRVAKRTAALARANQALNTVRECHQVLVRAAAEQGLLEEICRVMVESGGYRLAWVGYAGSDKDKTVQPVASAGRGASDLDAIQIHWGDDARGQNPTGLAIRSGTPRVARGAAAAGNCPLWAAQLAQRGHLSSVALPLRCAGHTFGALTICAQEPNAFDDAEVALLMELADDLAYGIGALRTRTERKHALLDLEQKEHLLAGVVETAPTLMLLTDADGHILLFNHACEALTGYARDEVMGRTVARLFGSDNAALAIHGSHCGIVPGCDPNAPFEDSWTTKDGDRHLIEWRCTTLPSPEDGRPYTLGIGVDITERRRTEVEMRKLSGAVEQAADMVVITDPNGIIEYVNPAFEQVTGYRRQEVLGNTTTMIKSGLQNQDFYKGLWRTILSGAVFRETFINKRKDGSLYYEEKTITPLRDAGGAIQHFLSTGKDITQRIQTEERLLHLANFDPLTDLPNRVLFADRLSHALGRAKRHDRITAVLCLDLDRFKVINETLGHGAGDQLIKEVAKRLTGCMREGDIVARLGGDEFALLLEDIAASEEVARFAAKVLDAFTAPTRLKGEELFVTTSIGISLYPNDGETTEVLLKNAETAMYRAKEQGRNRYRYYTADMNARAFERLSLETSLRHALDRNEFVLHYQPQIDLESGAVIGVEALIRWTHPEFGLVSPSDFIPMLEDTGLIIPVGEWVLRSACQQQLAWRAQGLPAVTMAVNLSAHQFQQADLAQAVEQVLDETGLEPHYLDLEITESTIMQRVHQTVETLERLNAMGVGLAIDDFGTGYSSLSYLTRFPVNSLKIDRSFVLDIPGNENDAEVVRAVIALAHSLELKVIAEGVETHEQLAFLHAHDTDRVQGYLFSRPVPAAEIVPFLRHADCRDLLPGAAAIQSSHG